MSQRQESTAGVASGQGRHAGSILRAVAYPTFLIAGAVLLFVANALIWVDSAVINNGNFSETVGDVLAQPQVQQRLGEVIAAQAVQNTDIEDRVVAELPDRVAPVLSPIVRSQFETLLAQTTTKLLSTDLAGNVLDAVISRLHDRLVAIMENDGTVLQVQGDQLVLELPEVLTKLFDRLGVTPPATPPAAPTDAANNASQPGVVVLLKDTSGLKQGSFLISHRHGFEALTLGAAFLAFAGVVVVAPTKSRGARLSGYAVVAVGVITLALVVVVNRVLESAASEHVVVQELVKGFTSSLKWQSLLIAAVGVAIVVLADQRGRGFIRAWGEKGRVQVERVGVGRVLLVILVVAAVLLFLL